MAQVPCIIVGFSVANNPKQKIIFDGEQKFFVKNINGYLQDAPNIFIERQNKPISDVPPICRGSFPTDDGNFILTSEEKNELIKAEPLAEKFIRPYMMGQDFLHRKNRFCIWLENANPSEKKMSANYETH